MKMPLEKQSYLVVDDFGDMRSMLRSMLSMFGVTRIATANNGKDAIRALERNKYDVILCDYNLGPGKDGQQVLEEARHRHLINVSTAFIMITAENTQDMVLGAIEYRPDNYLSKPFTKDLLRNRLEKVLAKKMDLGPIDQALERSDYRQAIALLDRRLAAKPRNLGELTRLKAEVCWQAGDYDDAKDIYEQVLAVRELPWARMGLGKVLYARKRYGEALEIFQDLVNDNRNLTLAYDWLARTYRALGDAEGAQEILTTAAALSPKSILRQQALGEIALKNQDFKTAETAFENAVRLGKHSVYKHPGMYSGLVQSKVSRGEAGKAEAVLRQMEKDFGKDNEARLYRTLSEAVVKHSTGDEAAAKQCLEQAEQVYARIGVRSAGPGLTLAMARTAAGIGERAKAEALFQSAVRNNHNDDDYLRDVEDALQETGLSDTPAELIDGIKQEIVELNNRGVKLASCGRIEDAIGLFEQAAEGMPGNRIINQNAAKVLMLHVEKGGRDIEALGKIRGYIERVKKLAPDDAAVGKLVEKFQHLVAGA